MPGHSSSRIVSTPAEDLFQHVPDELWSVIFALCPPIRPSYRNISAREPSRDPRLVPMVLASVCRSWRDIACHTPELWSTCWLSFWHPELNRLWLGRTAGVCMLHLYGSYHRFCSKEVDWEQFFLSILPFQSQWRSLVLDVWTWGTADFVPKFGGCPLKTVKFSEESAIPKWISQLLSSSSALQELHVGTISNLGYPVRNLAIRFPSLSTLGISATPHEVTLILSVLPQLRHLFVRCDEGSTIARFVPPLPVAHTNLVSLHLEGEWDPYALHLFSKLTLPSLRSFHMPFSFDADPDGFLAFARRSQCHIKELFIGTCFRWDQEIINILENDTIHPCIEILHIPGFEDVTIAISFQRLNEGCFAGLRQLFVSGRNFLSMPEGILADTVMSICGSSMRKLGDRHERDTEGEIGLQYVSVDYLDKERHRLDIARLVPLPDESAPLERNHAISIDLTLVDWVTDPETTMQVQRFQSLKLSIAIPRLARYDRINES